MTGPAALAGKLGKMLRYCRHELLQRVLFLPRPLASRDRRFYPVHVLPSSFLGDWATPKGRRQDICAYFISTICPLPSPTVERQEIMSEPTESKPTATFNNSLRQWQARYKAQQGSSSTAASPRTKVRPRRGRKAARPR
jgi:hypothetical protein